MRHIVLLGAVLGLGLSMAMPIALAQPGPDRMGPPHEMHRHYRHRCWVHHHHVWC